MAFNNLIFSMSGIRGIAGKDLTSENAKKIAIAYGLWLKGNDRRVILGRDTRISGKMLEDAIIEGLLSTNCNVINLGICPTPIIIFMKNKLKIPGGIIISGSHNPPEWNGIKMLSNMTFLSNAELEVYSTFLNDIELKDYSLKLEYDLEHINGIEEYINKLFENINLDLVKSNNKLSVVIDTGAGAGNEATPRILKELGCQVRVINNKFDKNNNFPREIEPIEKNLSDIISIMKSGHFNVGFAHDCDADRVAIIGDNGTCYPEDVGLALIAEHYFKKSKSKGKKVVFVTNLASSLMFEALAEKYNAEVIRVPVGERYLAEKMALISTSDDFCIDEKDVFGGEGSCGGVMDPQFNNARDGIFAAAKIVEILVETGEKISDLVEKLPKYYSFREKIPISDIEITTSIEKLMEVLMKNGESVVRIDNDLRFGHENDWFVLIHPSNTEPIIRVISEAKDIKMAKELTEKTALLVKDML